MIQTGQRLDGLIVACRRRVRVVGAAVCLLDAVLAVALWLLIAVLLHYLIDPFWGRTLLDGGIGLILLASAYRYFSRWVFPYQSDEAVIRMVQNRQTGSALPLLSAVQLRALAAGDPAGEAKPASRTPICSTSRHQLESGNISSRLIQAHLAHVEESLGRVYLHPSQLVGNGGLPGRLPVAGVILLLWAGVAVISPAWLGGGLHGIWAMGSPFSESFDVRLVDEPLVGDMSLEYEYPEYSGLEPVVVQGADGRVRGLVGTKVHMRTRSVRQVEEARIIFELEGEPGGEVGRVAAGEVRGGGPERVEGDGGVDGGVDGGGEGGPVGEDGGWWGGEAGGQLEMEVSDGRDLSATFFIGPGTGRYWFRMVDSSGKRIRERGSHPIEPFFDMPPKVDLLEPAQDMELGEDDLLTIRFSAVDDFGLEGATLVLRTWDGSELSRLPLQSEVSGRQMVGGLARPVLTLGAGGGDLLDVQVEVTDNDTVTGPKVGRSPIRRLRIISRAEQQAELTKRQGKMWEQMMDLLADRLEFGRVRATPGDYGSFRTGLGEIRQKSGSVVREVEAMTGALEEDEAWWDQVGGGGYPSTDFLTVLRTLQTRLESRLEAEGVLHQAADELYRKGSLRLQHLQALEKVGEQVVEELIKGVVQTDQLIQRGGLRNLRAMAQELIAIQHRLRDLLDSGEEGLTPQGRAAMLREIERLKGRLEDMLASLAGSVGQVPIEHLSRVGFRGESFEQGVQTMQEKLELIRSRLQGEDVARMKLDLDELAEQFGELLAAAEQDLDDYQEGIMGETAREMEALMGEVKQVTARQGELARQAGSLDEEIKGRQLKSIQGQLQDLFTFALAMVGEAEEYLGQINPVVIPEENMDGWVDAGRRVRILRVSLEMGELEQSLQTAVDSLLAVEAMSYTLRGMMDAWAHLKREQPLSRERSDSLELLEQTQEVLKVVVANLEAVAPDGGERELTLREQRKLEGIIKAQGRLGEQGQGLAGRVGRLQAVAPLLLGDSRKFGEKAADHMAQALGEARKGRLREAGGEMGLALVELAALESSLAGGGAGQGREGGKGGTRDRTGAGAGAGGVGGRGAGSKPGGGGGVMGVAGRGQVGGGRGDDERVYIPGAEMFKSPARYREEILDAMRDGVPAGYGERVRNYYEEILK